jgi:DNA invertase Pin-like site-specific DNA recombinase
VDASKVQGVIIAKLDRLTRSVKDLCTLLERFERRGVALVSVAESLDTGSAAGRLFTRRPTKHSVYKMVLTVNGVT